MLNHSNICKRAIGLFIGSLVILCYSYTPFYNYSSAIRVNDIVKSGDYIWGASQGGLMRIRPEDGSVKLFKGPEQYPDLNCTALSEDNKGDLWVGTKRGYLYKITPKGRHTIYTSYTRQGKLSKAWEITDIKCYGKYLIIGSLSGCSVYDTEKHVVRQNAVTFGNFSSSIVNCVQVHSDTLYLGCNSGIAKLDIAGKKIETNNFVDNSIWTTIPSDSTINSIVYISDSIVPMHEIAAMWNGSLFYSIEKKIDDFKNEYFVYRDSVLWRQFSSKVIALVPFSDKECWFGTEENYLYQWDGADLQQYSVEGLTFNTINRVLVDSKGTLWCTPVVRRGNLPWWQGVLSFNGDRWRLFTNNNPFDFGQVGDDGPDFLGIAEGPDNTMWFGNNSQNIKRYKKNNNRWDGFYIGYGGGSTFEYKRKNEGIGWGKCDAIACDSSRYMWFTAYNSDSGSVVCYDPAARLPGDEEYKYNEKYPVDSTNRYFFPKGSSFHLEVPDQLNVDAAGYIFLAGAIVDKGSTRLVVFRHNGNPLRDGIEPPVFDTNLAKVWHITSAPDSTTWIVTTESVYMYYNHPIAGPHLYAVDKAPANPTCVEVEQVSRTPYADAWGTPAGDSTKVETVLWLGTQQNGLARLNVSYMVRHNGHIDSVNIDSAHYFTETDGLMNNTVRYMDIDRKNGYLWVATSDGLSRYSLGHSFKQRTSNRNILAYPNPFVKSRHTKVVFGRCAPGTSVSVFTVDGKLLAFITDKGGNVNKTANEWTFTWQPPKNMMPGTYFYSATIHEISDANKGRGVAGKLLFLP